MTHTPPTTAETVNTPNRPLGRDTIHWRPVAALLCAAAVALPTAGVAAERPELRIEQIASEARAAGRLHASAGELVRYRLVVTNDTGRAAYGLQVIESWPEDLDFIDASATPAAAVVFDPRARELTWHLDAIAGESATLDVTARPLSTAAGKTLDRDVALKGAEAVVAASTPIAVQSTASVDLSVTGTSNRVRTGDFFEVSYALTVANNGPDPATEVVVDLVVDPITLDEIESGFFRGAGAGLCDIDTLECRLGDLGVTETVAVEAVARVHIDSTPISVPVDFRVSSNDTDIDVTNNVAMLSESLPEIESDEGGGAFGPGVLLVLWLFTLAGRRWPAHTVRR